MAHLHFPMDIALIVQPGSHGKTSWIEAKQEEIRANAGFIGKLGFILGKGGGDGGPGG